MTSKEQRELLMLKAELLRLQIAAEQLQQRQRREQQHHIDSHFSHILNFTNGLPSGNVLWNTLMLPLSWRKRLLVSGGLVLWQLLRKDNGTPAGRQTRRSRF